MLLVSLYAVAITVGLCLYWFLHSGSSKKPSSLLHATPIGENKDPPDDNGNCPSNATHYFKSHKSPRKVQLKEVHHSNETASVKVMTPDGVTLVQTNERREDKSHAAKATAPHKRRPAPPPPPKQPPKRPPPPPPPVTPPPSQVVVLLNGATDVAPEEKDAGVEKELGELRIDVKPATDNHQQQNQIHLSSASSPQLLHHSYTSSSLSPPSSCCGDYMDMGCPSSPELPLPPPPEGGDVVLPCDEPLPPPPDPRDVEIQTRTLDNTSLVYPKNSYMSYRSEKKLARQGFDGKYRRSFHNSASSMDLSTLPDNMGGLSPRSWEQMHNIRQHATTVIFHSDRMQPNGQLQRSSSQDCVLTEESIGSDNISDSQKPELSNLSNSISSHQCSEVQVIQMDPLPYHSTSQESRAKFEVQSTQQNGYSSNKIQSSKSKGSEDVIINCDSTAEELSLDNGILTDDSFVDSIESDTSSLTSVDHNQNAVKNNKLHESDSRLLNGNDLINRINSSTQTTDTPRLKRKNIKTKEELECERLSKDFIHHYGDVNLRNILVPAPNHRRISDYMDGLLNLELEKGGHPVHRCHSIGNQHRMDNGQWEEKWSNNKEKCNSLFNHCMEMNDNQNIDSESELKKRREELIISIGKKIETLRNEQASVREEMLQNEMLGQEICSHLQKMAKPNELEKYSLNVEEMEKIVNLLLSLSGRLARAENFLANITKDNNPEEKRILEAKRDKLQEQHEDARRLKESIDRRSNQVSTFLQRYLTEDEYADYDHFIKMKIKLIVDIREIDEKINLGEEQLAALRNSVVAHLWKSANS